MKNIFVPIFLTSLILPGTFHFLLPIDFHILLPLIGISLAMAALAFGFKYYKTSYALIALSFGLLFSAQFLRIKDDFNNFNDFNACLNFRIPNDEYVTVIGKLIDYPAIAGDHSILFLKTHSLHFNNRTIFQALNVKIKIQGDLRSIYKGDTVSIDTTLFHPTLNRNFAPNPIEHYLLVNRIHLNGYCKSAALVSLTKRTSFMWRMLGEWRNAIRNAIETQYLKPEGLDPKGVFLEAITIGERGEMSNAQSDQFKNAGVYHLLSISGAHMGMIALLCLGILKAFHVHLRVRVAMTAGVLLMFLAISGFQVPAERAVITLLLIFIARVWFLDVSIFNLIALSGFLLLVRNPAQFLDAGYILTFTLAAAILVGRRILMPLFTQTKWLKRIPTTVSEFLSANVSASFISLPLSLFYFNQYPFTGLVAGLILIPLTAGLTGLGILLIPLAPISSFLSSQLMTVIDLPLRLLFPVTSFFSDSIGWTIFRASPPLVWILIILIGFFSIPHFTSNRLKLAVFLLIVGMSILMCLNLFPYNPKNLEVFFLDVGQGDSEVVVFPGGDALLIDAGGSFYSDFEVGKKIVLPFLLQHRIRIRWVAISHFHPDHVYGVSEILPILKPEEVWMSSEITGKDTGDENDPGYERLMRSVPRSTRINRIHAPFKKQIGNCTVQLLYPDHVIEETHSHNNQSQVLRISDATHSFLFSGDIEKDVEVELSSSMPQPLRCDVLKVPHHGSRSSSHPFFLQCVSPKIAVFSYAPNNRFHFPHPSVINHYHDQRVPYLATATCGGIKIVSTPDRLLIE
ncbi:MAG: DNA internalization-related competence protein ComEC/Rec2 [Candidatus Omnitrophota bacterium]